MPEKTKKKLNEPSLFGLLKPYKLLVFWLVVFTIVGNAFNLVVPKIIGGTIDTYTQGNFRLNNLIIEFSIIAVLIFIFTYFSGNLVF